jgi:hypothetical protein
MEEKVSKDYLEKIDEVIRFLCLNTEITTGNLPDFRRSINNLFEMKDNATAA